MTHPTDAAIAQAFREYDEGDIVQMRTILARARELDTEKGGAKMVAFNEMLPPAKLYATPPAQSAEVVDGNVEAVRAKLLARSRIGLAKYGVTTERTDLTLADWLKHLQEELMDAAVYVEAAKSACRPDTDAEETVTVDVEDYLHALDFLWRELSETNYRLYRRFADFLPQDKADAAIAAMQAGEAK